MLGRFITFCCNNLLCEFQPLRRCNRHGPLLPFDIHFILHPWLDQLAVVGVCQIPGRMARIQLLCFWSHCKDAPMSVHRPSSLPPLLQLVYLTCSPVSNLIFCTAYFPSCTSDSSVSVLIKYSFITFHV